MKIHSDTLTMGDLYGAVPEGCYLEAVQRGSRSHARAFEVHMSAEPGTDRHGIKRRYANSGQWGADVHTKAATYIEWGDWMVELFKIDPRAVIGPYDGEAGFVETTTRWAQARPAFENAPEHAERWAQTLWGVPA